MDDHHAVQVHAWADMALHQSNPSDWAGWAEGCEWREGTSPSRSLRTVRDSLPSYGSRSPAWG